MKRSTSRIELSRSNLRRAVHDLANQRSHFDAGFLFVLAGHEFHERSSLVMRNEGDGRAAESAAGQARAENSRRFARQLHQDVQFLGAVLEIIAGALVALEHILAELLVIAVAQGALASDDTSDLGHHVARALVFAWRKFRLIRFN